jgi:hypothetical protein
MPDIHLTRGLFHVCILETAVLVVFDTNVWIADLALASNVGSAVRFYLRERKARIGLPEVVKLETEFHLRTTLTDHIDRIKSSHSQLLTIFGRLKEVVLPGAEDVETLVSKVFSNLGVEIREFPFTSESAKASLIRTVRKIPPSDKGQQFKDCVLWEDCMLMLRSEPVFLVTNDRAFYKNRETKQGLAEELQQELYDSSNEFRIFSSLHDLLAEIRTDISVPPESLIKAYFAAHGDELKSLAERTSFVLAGEPTANIDFFATEKPSHLYVTFSIELPCSDATSEGRTGAKIVGEGEATFDSEIRTFLNLSTRDEKLLYENPDGTETAIYKISIGIGRAVIGHRTVEHSVRYKL